MAAAWTLRGLGRLWLGKPPGFTTELCEYVDMPCSCWEGAWVILVLTGVPLLFMSVCWIPCGDVNGSPFVIESIVFLMGVAAMIAFIPSFMITFSGPGTYRRYTEPAFCFVLSSAYLVFLCIIPRHVFGIFPVPMAAIAYSILSTPLLTLPLLLLSLTPEARRDPQRRGVILTSFQVLLLAIILLAVAVPLALTAIAQLPQQGVAQVLTLVLPYILRKVFELVCFRLLREVRPELYPFIRLLSMGFYEGFLSVIMLNAASFEWFAVPLLVAFDILENAYHLCLITQTVVARPSEAPARWAHVVIGKSSDAGEGDMADSMAPCSGKHMFLTASVLVKEAMEVLLPLQIVVSFCGIYLFNPKWNHVTAGMSAEDFRYGCLVAGADILIEALMFLMLSLAIKHWCRLKPWKLLVRVLHHDLRTHALTLTGIVLYTSMLHNTFAGTDFTLNFNWLKDDSTWHGGFCWTVGDQTLQEACGSHWVDGQR